MSDISEEIVEGMIQLLLNHLNQTSLKVRQAIAMEIGIAMDKGNYGQPRGPSPNALSMGSSLFARM